MCSSDLEILDQVPVRVVGCRLVEEPSSVGVGVEHDLHGVDNRGLAAPRVSCKKVDPFMEGQGFMPDIVPVVQADPGQGLKPLTRHLPHLLPCKSRSKPAHRPP